MSVGNLYGSTIWGFFPEAYAYRLGSGMSVFVEIVLAEYPRPAVDRPPTLFVFVNGSARVWELALCDHYKISRGISLLEVSL